MQSIEDRQQSVGELSRRLSNDHKVAMTPHRMLGHPGFGFVLLPFCFVLGCSTSRVDERIAYWKTETTVHLPIGATKQQAEEFFSGRGASLKCCVRQPPGPDYHYVLERNLGRTLWTRYDVVVLVQFSAENKVADVKFNRWGIGF